MDKYIHYWHGKSTDFSIERFNVVKNKIGFPKPYGGFWASRIDAQLGWKEWASDSDDFICDESRSFTFSINAEAKILHINSVLDLIGLPALPSLLELVRNNPHCNLRTLKIDTDRKVELHMVGDTCSETINLDFEKLSEVYDAIEVNISNDYRLYNKLYAWDCDSILIMNPNIIQQEEI